jgi:hypothetical protein
VKTATPMRKSVRREVILRRVHSTAPLLAGLLLLACGGDQGSIAGPRLAVTVAVAPTTAVVHGGAAIQLTAAVSNDTSNRGVTWTVSCGAAPCGTISPTRTASGAPATYVPSTTLPGNGATITVTAATLADTSAAGSATLIPVGQIPGYDVGVDYHAYGTDNLHTTFNTIYDRPTVRKAVQAQLQGMGTVAQPSSTRSSGL